jgi:hypothetical protein
MIEIEKPSPVGIVKHREGTRHLESISHRLAPARLIIDQHRAGPCLDRQCDGLTFTEVELGKRDRLPRA